MSVEDSDAPVTPVGTPSSPPSGEGVVPTDADRLAAEIKADPPLHASGEVQTRAARLDDVAFARLVKRLRDDRALKSRDLDAFQRTVRDARKENEKREAAERAAGRRADRQPTWRDDLDRNEDTGRPRSSFANLCMMLENLYQGRLSFDAMAQRPCLDGLPFTDRAVSKIRRNLSGKEGTDFGKEDVGDAASEVGGEMSEVHPVRDYLHRCRDGWDGKKRLDGAARTLLGVKDKLSSIMVRRTLIAAAARGMHPGCKVDTLLILLGGQGLRKSTFFRSLGGQWFGDSKVDITDRKGQMVMASRWIYEWPEVDRVFAKHSDSDIKAFVSQQDDTFVPMFGRAPATFERSWIPVGSTNKPKFLTDVTGDRRVWVIDLRKAAPGWKVDYRKVDHDRDQLFGEAAADVDAYYDAQAAGVKDDENPHRWFLNDAEESARAEMTREFHVDNTWSETVGRWLSRDPIKCKNCKGSGEGFGRNSDGESNPCVPCRGQGTVVRGALSQDENGVEFVTPALVMTEALEIPLERHNANGTKIAETFADLGWVPGKRRRLPGHKHPVTPYYPPADVGEQEATADVTT